MLLQHRGAVQFGQTLHIAGYGSASGGCLAHPQGAVLRRARAAAVRQGMMHDHLRYVVCEAKYKKRTAECVEIGWDLNQIGDGGLAYAQFAFAAACRGVATFCINECRRAEDCLDLLKNGDFAALSGCVIALIRQESSDDLVKKLSASGYRSFACQPSSGSRVEFMRSCEG